MYALMSDTGKRRNYISFLDADRGRWVDLFFFFLNYVNLTQLIYSTFEAPTKYSKYLILKHRKGYQVTSFVGLEWSGLISEGFSSGVLLEVHSFSSGFFPHTTYIL